MEKKLKKIIVILGILFLLVIIILNLLFTSFLDSNEHIIINYNNWIYDVGIIITVLGIYSVCEIINNLLHKKKVRFKIFSTKKLFTIILVIYAIFNIIWIIVVNPKVVGDSVHVCNLAQTFYRGDVTEFLPNMTYLGIPLSQYMQLYTQQIPIAFVFSVFFRIIHFDIMEILRIINVLSNIFIIVAIYKISIQLSKKYVVNKILLFILILTFISLLILSTFIYGDIPGLALCLFAVYFIMRYTETEKIKYFIFSCICMMIAYMFRMNSLIFIIAIVIYLLLNLLKKRKCKILKRNLIYIVIIGIYIIISITPSSLIKKYYLSKYDLDSNMSYPTISYILMAMEESPRGNGWYNEDIAKKAVLDPNNIKAEYNKKVYDRLKFFSTHLDYTFDFYIKKITSMWTENTYSAIRNSITNDNKITNTYIGIITFYQKALLVLSSICSIIFLIKNRKQLSLEIILLITIFVGGFAFHIIWEAKSRYIIPYIIILIPIASLCFNAKK